MMKISEHAGTAAAVSSITVLINIVLNAVFIYGAFGIESMNVRGAAIATLISRVLELMLSITFSYRPGYIRLKIREQRPTPSQRLCVISFAVSVQVYQVQQAL